jgi:Zn-dependent peptidase ImmA (M78 family)
MLMEGCERSTRRMGKTTRRQGTFTLDPAMSVHHLLLNRDHVGRELVDALIAEFLRLVRVRRRKSRTAVVLWRGQFETEPPQSWPYWSLAIEERRAAWYKDLRDAAEAIGLQPAMGMSTPSGSQGIGAAPYLLVDACSVAVFNQRRRVHSPIQLRLAGTTFDARTVRYRYSTPPVSVAADEPAPRDDLVHRFEDTVRLADVRRRSPLRMWPEARDVLTAASKHDGSANLSYDEAVSICESIGIPVVETRIAEYGRLVIEPLWAVDGDTRRIDDCRVTVALKTGLPPSQKRLALLHELGHYVHHLRYLASFMLQYHRIAQNPGLEGVLADRFPSDWHVQRNRTMELEADYFSACFVVPHMATGWLRDPQAPLDVTTAKGMILSWLHQAFDEGWSIGRIGSEAVEHAWRTVAESPYDVAGPWFDRLAHCVALRGSERLVEMVKETVQLENDMRKIDALARLSQPRRRDGSGRFIERCSESEIATTFSVPNRWDPVIVEPRGVERAAGYLPLKPMFTKGDAVDVFDWSRTDGHSPGFAGSIEDWRNTAEASDRGLMLFPMIPVEHALRRRYS